MNLKERYINSLIVSFVTDMDRTVKCKEDTLNLIRQNCERKDVETFEKNFGVFKDVVNELKGSLNKCVVSKPLIHENKILMCPTCHHRVKNIKYSYCNRCGQKLLKKEGKENAMLQMRKVNQIGF
jgi:hypothetical protein